MWLCRITLVEVAHRSVLRAAVVQGKGTARVMVAISITLQLLTIAFTLATGGMRVEESTLFLFGKGCTSFPNPTKVLDNIYINGDKALDVWRRFCDGTGGSLLKWFETAGACITFECADVKSWRGLTKDMRDNDGLDARSVPVKAVFGRMPELGLLEPIRIVLILCALVNVCALPDGEIEVNTVFAAAKANFTAALQNAAACVIGVVGGKIGWNSLFRASQSQEIPLKRRNHASNNPKIVNLADSNLHTVGVLFTWYGYCKELFTVRHFQTCRLEMSLRLKMRKYDNVSLHLPICSHICSHICPCSCSTALAPSTAESCARLCTTQMVEARVAHESLVRTCPTCHALPATRDVTPTASCHPWTKKSSHSARRGVSSPWRALCWRSQPISSPPSRASTTTV
jgi:hypothetical protein